MRSDSRKRQLRALRSEFSALPTACPLNAAIIAAECESDRLPIMAFPRLFTQAHRANLLLLNA